MLNKFKNYIDRFLKIFRKDYEKSYYNFITKSPCGLVNLKERKVKESHISWGDDEYHKVCFNATQKEYECFKKYRQALTPKEFYELDDSDEDKSEFFWLIESVDLEEKDYKNITAEELHIDSIEFTQQQPSWVPSIKCDNSMLISFERGSEVNGYTFICFDGCRICHFSFYS